MLRNTLCEFMIKHGAASVVLAAVAAGAAGCAPTEAPEPETLPPAPADATASCVYQLVASDDILNDPDLPTTTLWLDAGGRVIRVDGWRYADAPYREIPTAYDLTWDAEDRLLTVHAKDGDVQLVYSTDQVLEMYSDGSMTTHHLLDGQDIRDDHPTYAGTSQRRFTTQSYDAAGRLSSQTSGLTDLNTMADVVQSTVEFTYDAKDRITTFKETPAPAFGSSGNYAFYYIETANRLIANIVDVHDPKFPALAETWTFEFDTNHRLVRDAVDYNGDGNDDFWDEFRYRDGEIDVGTHAQGFESTMRVTGPCAAPSVVLAPVAPLPFQLRQSASFRSLPNEAAAALAALGAAGSLIPYPTLY